MIKKRIMKLIDLSLEVGFPLFLIPPYMVGIILMHFFSPEPVAILKEFVFVLVELSIQKLAFPIETDFATGIRAHITMLPLILALLFMLNPLYIRLFPEPVFHFPKAAYHIRTITITIDFVYIAVYHCRNRVKRH